MRHPLRRFTWIILLAVVFFFMLFVYLHVSETGTFPDLQRSGPGILFSILTGSILAVTLYFANTALDRWIPWRTYFSTRLLVGYSCNVLLALGVTVAAGAGFLSVAGGNVLWPGFSAHDTDLYWKLTILYLAALFIYNVIYALLFSYQHYTVTQIEKLQRERRQLELQFEALKSQISPHYLFNSLNTISSLLYKDLPSAEQFIRRLAQTYQFILTTRNKPYVSLQEEISFVESYYYLLRIRFQQQLHVEINLPPNVMNSKIPPLTLQMLIENAVKHNPMHTEKKLLIYITAQDNTRLKVINTKTGTANGVTSFQIGLDNIQKRYRYFTDKKIEIRDDEKFTVSLPLILFPPKLKPQLNGHA
jgi:two-component system, LytTR family, sensor kinase